MDKNIKVSFLVLDYKKKEESYLCLKSIKEHAKFAHKVIFLDNGGNEDYPVQYFKEGLIDELIINKENTGLGLGTKSLFGICDTEYAIYFQNDQCLLFDIYEGQIDLLIQMLEVKVSFNEDEDIDFDVIKSISFAGPVCGMGVYSERAYFIRVNFYKSLEPLSIGGAGPYANLMWREEQIQNIYKEKKYSHYPLNPAWVIDNGHRAIRQNPDGSIWEHRPDSKELKLISGPIKEKYVYPKFSDTEWSNVLELQSWPEWKIPENETKDSFRVPGWEKYK